MTTPNLALPLLADSQSRKHVTVNEALSQLDGIVQLSVISTTETAPPASPAEGDRYIVAAGATGSWAGWDESVALWSGGAWLQLVPQTGWLAWDQDAGELLTYDGASGWAALSTGGSSGRPVTYNPFAKRVEAPLAADFATDRSTAGAAGSITDDAKNGLTITSTSGTEAARLIHTRDLPANWEVIEFACESDQSGVAWGSNGFVLMGAAGTFVTVGVGSNSGASPAVRVLAWNADGTYNTDIALATAIEGWSAYFRLIHRGGKIIVYHSYDGAAWTLTGTIDETTHLGGSALYIGPSACNSTTMTVTWYADDDIVPQFAGFVGAGGGTAPVLADMTLAEASSGAAIGAHVAEELLTGLSGASVTSTIAIPDRAIVLAVSTRTVTGITGATSYDCGVSGDTAKFGGTLGIAAGSTNVGAIGPQAYYAATPIVLTANGGSFTGGDVRIAIQYLLPTAPSA